ncbi:unnamed protein product [Rhizophagus irregularis]|nr:unnamed protein product [Rhizophagus irregularis]
MSMSTDFTTILLRDFNNLLEEGVDHNVIIQAGEEPNTKSFRAHSGILRARCPYFRTALSETWVKPQEDGVIIFKKPNISAEIFDIILKYIYTGDGEDLKNVVFSRVQEHSRAVLCSQAIGPCFGSGDLVMGGTHANFNLELGCSCKRQSYERHLIINHDRFSVVEYEIFKVTPKLGVRNSQVFNNNNISRTSGRFSLLLSHNHYFTPNNQQPHYN